MSEAKKYLGDGVYVCIKRGMICLTTSDGMTDTNTIYMEPEVYEALVRYHANVVASLTGSADR